MLLALQGATSSVSEHVKIQQLALIKWKDDQGQIQRFYLMEKISYEWRTLGENLGFEYSKLESIAAHHRDNPRSVAELFWVSGWTILLQTTPSHGVDS